jgi:hypothetical protein
MLATSQRETFGKNKVKRIFTTEDTEVSIVNRAAGALNNNKVFLCTLCGE